METPPKIDLKKHTPKAASKWILIRLIFYIVGIAVLCALIWSQMGEREKTQAKNGDQIKEVEGVEVEVN